MERETALDQLLEGIGGRKTLLNNALLLRKDSTARKTTEGGIAAIGKPGRTNSTRHRRQAKAVEDEDGKGVVKIQELLHNDDKHEGNNIDDAVDVKDSTSISFSATEVRSKNKRKKVIHDSNDFRLFK